MIDEVDRATDFADFAAFLGLLRDMYLARDAEGAPALHSVALAGVHDVKNLKKRIRPDSEHAYNSPWNIASDFDVDLSFSAREIAAMLDGYEADHATGMDAAAVGGRISFYTSGYPFLVSRLCKTIDEKLGDWSPAGVDAACADLLMQQNTLFDDMAKNVLNNAGLRSLTESILIRGERVSFAPDNPDINLGLMYGILKNGSSRLQIANVIFETRLTNLFVSLSDTARLGERWADDRSLYIRDGRLDMDAVVSRFAAFMTAEYRDEDSAFVEAQVRLLFLCFLIPIINGTGSYAVEPETRGGRRMDVVVFWRGEEHIVELTIWRGEAYEAAGVEQLAGYLRSRGQGAGWLVSFCDLAKSPREGGVFQADGVEIRETIVAYRDKA
jgi:hypothetical protein